MRISDWSSDVCSSDLLAALPADKVNLTGKGKAFEIGENPSPRRAGIGRGANDGNGSGTQQALQVQGARACAAQDIICHADSLPDPAFMISRQGTNRKRVVEGKRVSVRVDPGGRR